MEIARATAALLILIGILATAAVAQAPTVPNAGIFVPNKSLGEIAVGMTKAEVLAQWGRRHGVCRNCSRPTWYFNLKPFEPQGAGVEFRRGRVSRVFTVWRPLGWRTADGLELGARLPELRAAIPALDVRPCESYTAYLAPSGRGPTSVYYVFRGRLWGFGLMRSTLSPCL